MPEARRVLRRNTHASWWRRRRIISRAAAAPQDARREADDQDDQKANTPKHELELRVLPAHLLSGAARRGTECVRLRG